MAEYRKRDIAGILKKPPRTIEFWTSSGLVIPEIQPSEGKGRPRVYSGRNLQEFAMVELLARMGVSLDTIRRVLSVLRNGKWIPPREYFQTFSIKGRPSEERYNELVNKEIQEHTIRFESFWTSAEWGVTTELVFVAKKMIDLEGNLIDHEWFYQANKLNNLFRIPESLRAMRAITGGVQTMIWLGEIRNRAVKLVLV